MTSKPDALYFVPLGGADEIGMNFNLYGYGPEENRRWIIVDCGVTFGDLSTPGVDVIMPDPRFIEERAHQLEAIILTHAHEDHMGAVAHLWQRLRCPIYATPFTAWLVRDRLQEKGILGEVPVHELPLESRIKVGPFDLELITMSHSIPEPNGIAIRTPAATVLHTGDWKLDANPVLGGTTDAKALKALGDEGVTAMVCDSTNVFSPGEAGSEASVREEMIKVVGQQTGRVAIASFASNVARLKSAIEAAEANGRKVCLVGRSMHRMTNAAKAVGILSEAQEFVDEEDAARFPPHKICFICTGSQGEPRAALSRIAEGSHRNVKLGEGDVVLFSSRMIPGNERGIFDLMNKLAERGVRLITERDHPIHVSGHPCRDELKQMYEWVRPQNAIPVHGERRHLIEHAAFAKEQGVKKAIAPRNGDVFEISAKGIRIVDEAPWGQLHLDGNFIVRADAPSMRERRKMSWSGVVSVAMAIDSRGRIVSGPDIRTVGLPEEPGTDLEDFLDELADAAEAAFGRLNGKARTDEDAVEDAVRMAVRREANRIWGRKPVVEAMVLMT